MDDGMSPFVRNLLIVAAVALVVVVLNLEIALLTVGMIVRFVFFIAIAVVAYFYWRDFGRREIETWSSHAQWVFYAAVALFVVDVGWWMVGGARSGPNALAFFLVAGACIYVGIRTWRDQRNLSA
jgi:hypothetical protein